MELLALLLLLTGTLATGIKVIPLDMAKNSFDDQYRHCRGQMMQWLPKINHTEFAKNSLYAQVWAKATAQWHSRPYLRSLLPREEGIALVAYSLQTNLYSKFNAAVRERGRSSQYYRKKFYFKVLHFLITEALRDLRRPQTHPRCLHVYRGVRGIRFTAKPGQIIRFGQFASSSLRSDVAAKFGTDTFFVVYTCHGAIIQYFSVYPQEQEVLIPPFETFTVLGVTYQGNNPQIHLRSHGVHSRYNCVWLQGPHHGRIPGKEPVLEEATVIP